MSESTVPVTASVMVEYKSFTCPNFARTTHQDKHSDGIPISELNQNALDALVKRWMEDIYEKSFKNCPYKQQAYRKSHDGRGPG